MADTTRSAAEKLIKEKSLSYPKLVINSDAQERLMRVCDMVDEFGDDVLSCWIAVDPKVTHNSGVLIIDMYDLVIDDFGSHPLIKNLQYIDRLTFSNGDREKLRIKFTINSLWNS